MRARMVAERASQVGLDLKMGEGGLADPAQAEGGQGDAELRDLAMLYSLDMKGYEEHKTLGDLITQMVGGKPVVGDKSEWSGMLWTIAEVEGNRVRKIGVKPSTKKQTVASEK